MALIDLEQDLILLNQKIRGPGHQAGYRTETVFCLSHDKRKVTFPDASEVPALIKILLEDFEKSLKSATLPQAFARFWYLFISIHPFQDGNGRTGKEFLLQKAREYKYELNNIELLDRFLMEGNYQSEITKLTLLFEKIISPTKETL